MKIKSLLKLLIPPLLISVFRSKPIAPKPDVWSGDYISWAEAEEKCTGYDSALILEKCKDALLKVKNGEAVYERDSVLFNEIQYSWGLLAGLERAALENDGKLCVLDFGGSLGSTYYQNKHFLSVINGLQWCIVEQPHFVDCGKENFENEQLKFYYTIEECLAKHKPNVLVLSGVLQYLEKPYEWLEKFVALNIRYIIVDRTTFVEAEREMLTVQNVPESIYKASYPAWFFNESLFLKKLEESYCKIASFPSHEGYVIKINNCQSVYKGFIWKAKS